MDQLPIIDAKKEKDKIVSFIQKTLQEQNIKNVVIGMSGGIDSSTVFYLLKNAVPLSNIFVAHLYHFNSLLKSFESSLKTANIPTKNIFNLSIKSAVDEFRKILNLLDNDRSKLRLGNIMARIRMILIYDLAKKHNALVLGTEDKSEFLLGYFTRFGDEASDIEPIRHLFKTQVYSLAKYLGVPERIIKQKPSPGLWIGHLAKEELGFSYQEADIILHLYFDKKLPIEEIRKLNLPNADKVISFALQNSFKHNVPYAIK